MPLEDLKALRNYRSKPDAANATYSIADYLEGAKVIQMPPAKVPLGDFARKEMLRFLVQEK